MPNIGSSITGGSVAITGASTPTIYNVSMATAGTEYSQALSSDTKMLTIRSRSGSNLRLAFASNGTNTAWVTVPGGATYSEINLSLTSATLYLQADSNGEVAEVLEWS